MGPMPIAAEINGRLYAIHTDQLNTPRQLTDENGQEVWQWAISGFGEVEPTTAQTGWIRARNGSAGQISNTRPVTFILRFPGQQFDEETGLHYNHHRYYDPYLTVGYTEADPLGLSAGWNRFVYVDGSPLDSFDPSGLVRHVTGKTIQCAKGCTIRIDYILDESTGSITRHLHWECKGSSGVGGEFGGTSHGETLENAPEHIKDCARKSGFEPDQKKKGFFEYFCQGATIAGGGYIAYRAIRMIPSLAPPFWPSIPFNLAAP